MANMLDVALGLAACGWSVIPVKARGKKPALNSWKQYQITRAGPDQIKLWFNNLPSDINIGIITGKVSGIVVVDIDPEKGGTADGFPPTNLAVTTGGGGQHLYYKLPPGGFGSYTGPGGIDIRGEGGFVVAPPSIHKSGEPYVWDPDEEPGTITVEQLEVLAPRQNGKAGSSTTAQEGKVREGGRNDSMARWTGYHARETTDLDELTEKMQGINLERCDPPLSKKEVEKIVRSIHSLEVKSSKSKIDPLEIESDDDDGDMLPVLKFGEYAIKHGGKTVEWLIPGYIPERTICFIYGPPQSFKTWVEFDLAVSIATGLPFFGQADAKPLRKGPVIIIQQEDNHESIAERIATIYMGRLGVSEPSIEDDIVTIPEFDEQIDIHMFEERNFRFDRPEMIQRLHRRIRKLKPVAVFFDPMYSLVPMDDYLIEAPGYMFPLKTLRDKYGCSFFIVHHTKKSSVGTGDSSGMIGSNFINAFAETRIALDLVTGHPASVVMKRRTKTASPRSNVRLGFDIYDASADDPGEWRYNVAVSEITEGQYRKLADPESMDFDDDENVKPATEKDLFERLEELSPRGMTHAECLTWPRTVVNRLMVVGDVELAGGDLFISKHLDTQSEL